MIDGLVPVFCSLEFVGIGSTKLSSRIEWTRLVLNQKNEEPLTKIERGEREKEREREREREREKESLCYMFVFV